MARRTRNRKELRAQHEAAEARAREEEERDDEDEEEDETDDDEGDDEGDEEEVDDDLDEEERPRRKAKSKTKKDKEDKPKPARLRPGKVVRMRIVWTVYNNSHQAVARFEYPRKHEAEALAAKLTADKKSTHFVQAVKEPMEEKEKDKK